MASDSNWVEDVRRWCVGASSRSGCSPFQADSGDVNDDDALGYEAANPPLQAAYWPQSDTSSPIQEPPR